MHKQLETVVDESGIDLGAHIHLLITRGKTLRNTVRWRYISLLAVSLGVFGGLFLLMRNTLISLDVFFSGGFLVFGIGVLLVGHSSAKLRATLAAGTQIEKDLSVKMIWDQQDKNYSSISDRDLHMFDVLAVHVFKAAHTNAAQVLECPTCELLLSAISVGYKTNHAMNATFQYLEQTDAVSLGELLTSLTEAISGEQSGFIDPEGAELLTNDLIHLDCPLETLLQTTDNALVRIGQLFENQEIYYPQILQAALAAKNTLRAINEEFPTIARQRRNSRILLGVIKGDIHDIGKNIVKMFLEFNGYEIIDLGVDISPTEFVQAISQYSPDLIGISAFINTVIPVFKDTVLALRENGYTKPILAGGIAINALTVKNLKQELETAIPGESGEIFYAHNVQEVLKVANSLFQQERRFEMVT